MTDPELPLSPPAYPANLHRHDHDHWDLAAGWRKACLLGRCRFPSPTREDPRVDSHDCPGWEVHFVAASRDSRLRPEYRPCSRRLAWIAQKSSGSSTSSPSSWR